MAESIASAVGPRRVLAIDTGSPLTSVALGEAGRAVATREAAGERSSAGLLPLIDAALADAGWTPADLDGLVGLAGPGSFTGLRVGLATLLGLHQALGVAATALPTLEVMAAAVGATEGPVVAAVDALRGEWQAQRFAIAGGGPRAEGEPELLTAPALAARAAGGAVVAFDGAQLAADPGWDPRVPVVEPGALAPVALRLAAGPETLWDPARLIAPVYSRPPAARRAVGRSGAELSRAVSDPQKAPAAGSASDRVSGAGSTPGKGPEERPDPEAEP